MKLNYFTRQLSTIGRWLTTTLFCLSAIAFIWQGAFFSGSAAMAAPATALIAASDVGNQVKSKTREDAGRAKNFIRDTADKVEKTANKMPIASRTQQITKAVLLSAKPREIAIELRKEQSKTQLGLRKRWTRQKMQSKAQLIKLRMLFATKRQTLI